MRLWEFDRLGATTSESFNIHENGLLFVRIFLSFLLMNDEQLCFDSNLMKVDDQQFITINKDGKEKRLIITRTLSSHAACIAGRATTCWEAYSEENNLKTSLVVKDSWQDVNRSEEGELIRKATKAGVINISTYYHHETVLFNGKEDSIRSNVRNGMSTEAGSNPFSPETTTSSQTPRKRPSQIEALGPTRKRLRSRSTDAATEGDDQLTKDKIRCRIITESVGQHLRRASLYQAGILHRDISLGNILLNEDQSDGFLIDLDYAADITQLKASKSSEEKIGTKVFMAIEALAGEPNTFMHDLESFFWVLLWIGVHYTAPDTERHGVEIFEGWTYDTPSKLALSKTSLIAWEYLFQKMLSSYVTPYCGPLIPCIKELWKIVFPQGRPWYSEDLNLYTQMKTVIKDARDSLAAAEEAGAK